MFRPNRPTPPLNVTRLEDRTVLNGVTATLSGTALSIVGTGLDDTVDVRQIGDYIRVQTNNSGGTLNFSFSKWAVKSINISGGDGNDTLTAYTSVRVPVVMAGGNGNDALTGSIMNDQLYGEAGNDRLYGGAGNDLLDGGDGNDQLFGHTGTDTLFGGNGNDWLEAGALGEPVNGGFGNDWNAHVWAVNGTSVSDIHQTGTGTCVFMSSLATAADQGINLASRINYVGNFTYAVRFYDPTLRTWADERVTFDGSMVTYNSSLMDPENAVEGESWVILMHRGYLQKFHDIDVSDGAALAAFGGEASANLADAVLTGRTAETYLIPSTPSFIQSSLAEGKLVSAGCSLGLGGHYYAVLGVHFTDGEWRIDLHNPWGVDSNPNNLTRYFDAKPFDGVITMRYDDFVAEFDQVTVG